MGLCNLIKLLLRTTVYSMNGDTNNVPFLLPMFLYLNKNRLITSYVNIMSLLCCREKSWATFVSILGMKNWDIKVHLITLLAPPYLCLGLPVIPPYTSQSSFPISLWFTLIDRSSPPRAIMTLMGGSVLLDSWVSMVALMAFYREKTGLLWGHTKFCGLFNMFGR